MRSRDEWLLVEPLFDRALDLDAEGRKALVETVKQGSPQLAGKLLQLLDAAEGAREVIIDRSLSEVAASFVEHLPRERTSGLTIDSMVGEYRLLELLGEGGTGRVFRARREQTMPTASPELDVALKVLLTIDEGGAVTDRFDREMRILEKLDHPGVATVTGVGFSDQGFPYYAMRLIKGPEITAFARQHSLTTDARIGLLRGVCDTMQAAHDKGIIHRDLKPSNILVEGGPARGFPVVLDFGIARENRRVGLTLTGQILGTPGYMSPEQGRGDSREVTVRSDVFSLGVVAHELFSGSNPFARGSGVETVAAVVRDPAPPLSLHGFDGFLSSVVERCLTKDPKQRFDSMRDLEVALTAVQIGLPEVH